MFLNIFYYKCFLGNEVGLRSLYLLESSAANIAHLLWPRHFSLRTAVSTCFNRTLFYRLPKSVVRNRGPKSASTSSKKSRRRAGHLQIKKPNATSCATRARRQRQRRRRRRRPRGTKDGNDRERSTARAVNPVMVATVVSHHLPLMMIHHSLRRSLNGKKRDPVRQGRGTRCRAR